jgi:hypothetical protein
MRFSIATYQRATRGVSVELTPANFAPPILAACLASTSRQRFGPSPESTVDNDEVNSWHVGKPPVLHSLLVFEQDHAPAVGAR